MKPEFTVDYAIIDKTPIDEASSAAQPIGGSAKRYLDILIAGSALVVLLPLVLTLLVLIWRHDRKSPIFFHRRIGWNGRPFHCLKFRSMAPNSSELLEAHLRTNVRAAREWKEKQKLQNDPRVTPIGRVMRATSLDELPQLINVLKGDMSIVGPRPIVMGEIERYGAEFNRYCACRPGLTGLWQISGRSDCSYAERVRWDVSYAENWSMRTDLSVIFKTIPVVLLRKGSY